jgi:hypothetical protein
MPQSLIDLDQDGPYGSEASAFAAFATGAGPALMIPSPKKLERDPIALNYAAKRIWPTLVVS